MSARAIVAVAVVVAMVLFAIWLLIGAPPQCPDGKLAVMGEGKWYCVEGTEAPTKG